MKDAIRTIKLIWEILGCKKSKLLYAKQKPEIINRRTAPHFTVLRSNPALAVLLIPFLAQLDVFNSKLNKSFFFLIFFLSYNFWLVISCYQLQLFHLSAS